MQTLNPILHELAGCLRFIGMRDRLRCPLCGAVGTWKPHGYAWDWPDREHDLRRQAEGEHARRWMCKWCGYYVGPEPGHQVLADPERGCWMLRRDASPRSTTPAKVIKQSAYPRMWPWRG